MESVRAGAARAAAARPLRRWWTAALVYRDRRVLSMLFLGFSSGLPFYLVFQTLSAWLRQDGVVRATIGMLAWAGLIYPLKFAWSPIVDRLRLPLLYGWLGRRRSWMLLAQLGIAAALVLLSGSHPARDMLHVALGAAFLAFCAATQDIAIDAWRIEAAPDEMQGAMAASYQLGYRVALIIGSAGALGLAQGFGWRISYVIMAVLVAVGVGTTFAIREPAGTARRSAASEARALAWLERKAHWPAALRHSGANFIGAVLCPALDFFQRRGVASAVLLLALAGSYRLTDYAMGSMVNSFYIDHGYTLEQIATVVKIFGLTVSLVGVVLAGALIARAGIRVGLALGSVLLICSNLGFAWLATTHGPTLVGLAAANSLDNLAQALDGTALIAFLSSLTSARYTATQYALFSSFFVLTGKLVEGTSGFVVDAIGYAPFFVYTASLSIVPLLLLWWLSRRRDLGPPGGALVST